MSEKTKVGAVQLEPCPFCGSTNCSLSLREGAWKFAYCPDCLTEGPAMDNDSDAIAAWNRRATPAVQADVPYGYALVPIKPTAEIVRAGGAARIADFNRNGTTLTVKDANRQSEAMYRAMVDAALAASSNGERS